MSGSTRTPTLSPRGPLGAPPRADEAPQVVSTASVEARARWALGLGALVGTAGIGVGVFLASGGDEDTSTRLSTLPPIATPSIDAAIGAPLDAGSDAAPIRLAEITPPLSDLSDGRVRRRASPPAEHRITTPTSPAGTASTASGVVNVVTPGGWADVVLAGRVVGRTPRQVTLPAGTHTLELRPFGRTPGERVEVVVEAGGTARVVRPVTR